MFIYVHTNIYVHIYIGYNYVILIIHVYNVLLRVCACVCAHVCVYVCMRVCVGVSICTNVHALVHTTSIFPVYIGLHNYFTYFFC